MQREPESAEEAHPTAAGLPDGPLPEPIRRRGLIAKRLLDERAVFVVKRLQRVGHEAYLVGGCVRDLLAGLEPKDFDVATNARPNRIKRLFRSARVIGRRFRLVHIRFPGNHVIETSTFRGDPARNGEDTPSQPGTRREHGATGGSRRRDWRDSAENVFGTAIEDAWRRDFTVNALFYDPIEDVVIDHVGGLPDLENGIIRSIGDPTVRLREDPVRMLRAVHFARRMDFALHGALEDAILEHAKALREASQARLYVELIKMLGRGQARGTFHRLHALGVLRVWLPELANFLDEPIAWPRDAGGTHAEASRGEPVDAPPTHATWNLLGAADRWGMAAHNAPESLALAVLFGPWLLTTWRRSKRRGFTAFGSHMEQEFTPIARRMSVPRRVATNLKEILWMLDDLREPPPLKRCRRMVIRLTFPLALAFYELDLMARIGSTAAAQMWRELAEEAGVRLGFDGPPRGSKARRNGRRGSRTGGARRGTRAKRRGRRSRRPAPEPEAGAWKDPPPA